MLKTVLAACALLCALTINADARQRHRTPGAERSCIPTNDVMRPCQYNPNFLAGVRSINVTMKRVAKADWRSGIRQKPVRRAKPAQTETASYGAPTPSLGYSIARPVRYIAGRLVCAINIGAALAERGIKGTGSALAHSYDHWGRPSAPVPGAVAVSDRRGGGHVALVSRVEGSRVWVWNATGGRRGWHEIEYTNRRARYRVAG